MEGNNKEEFEEVEYYYRSEAREGHRLTEELEAENVKDAKSKAQEMFGDKFKYIKAEARSDVDKYIVYGTPEDDVEMDSVKLGGNEIKAVSDGDGEFLGRVFWTTIGRSLTSEEKMIEYFDELDLSHDYRLDPPTEKRVWKRALKEMEWETEEKVDVDGEEKKMITEFMVRKLDTNIRQLVKEVRRTDKGRLEYKRLLEWRYDDDADEAIFKPLEVDRETAKEYHQDLVDHMNEYRESYTDDDIRRMIYNTMKELNRITMRSSGGVYFIPEENSDVVLKFKKLLNKVDENHSRSEYRSELYQIPVISSPDQKDMIEEKIKEETVKYATSKIDEFKDLIDGEEEISSRRFNRYINELDDVKEKKKKYEELLSRNLNIVDDQIDILKKQLRKVSNKVKSTQKEKTKSLEDY